MTEKRDNYAVQAMDAKRRFLTYDQQELILRCRLRYDADYFYITFLNSPYRICRKTGNMERQKDGAWIDGNGYNEVMTILDWLCDSRADRYITGRWINLTHSHYFHRDLQEKADPNAVLFDGNIEGFREACRKLGGEEMAGADAGYVIELLDGLKVFVQLWRGDEEFPPNLRCLWDENTHRYLRYETTWFAAGELLSRLREYMKEPR